MRGSLGIQLGAPLDNALVPDHHFEDENAANSEAMADWAFDQLDKVRFYLTNATAPTTSIPLFVSGATGANWEDTSQAIRRRLGLAPSGVSAVATGSETSTDNAHDVALGQWVSTPATREGELSGATVGDLRVTVAREQSDSAANLQLRYVVYVVDSTGTVIRPTAISRLSPAAFTTTPNMTGLQVSGALTLIPIQVGDQLVIEVGYRAVNTSATAYTGSIRYGGTGPDLAVDDVGANAERPPWVDLTGPFLSGVFVDGAAPTPVAGVASAPLGALTATATGVRRVTAAASAPLGGLTATAAGTRRVSATASASLGLLTATSAGTPRRVGTASAPLGALTATATDASSATVSYAESTTIIPNPERGLFQYTETHYYSDNTGHVALNSANLAASRTTDGRALVFRYCVLEKFLSLDTIDSTYLSLLATDLATIRTAGCKVILRFAYSTSGDTTPPYDADPPVRRVLGHIAQLAPVLNAEAAVIDSVQQGFIGMWGEQYYSDNFGDLGTASVQQYNDRLAVLAALLDHLNPSIYVLVRYPGLKHRWFG